MGMEWAPEPAQQRKVVASSGGVAVKLLMFLLLGGLALRLLVGPSSYLLLPAAAPPRERTGDGGTPLTETDDRVLVGTGSGPIRAPDKKGGSQEEIEDAAVDLIVPVSRTVPDTKGGSPEEDCNLFHGEWIPHSSGPAYTNASCRFIESPQNCMTNGRPDTDYLYWRWKPYGCDIPLFDGKKFLDGMQGKHWALIGDSILRNHIQSLLCLLSKVEDPTEVYHDEAFKSRRWYFPSHNFTVSLVWVPFLVKAEIFEDDNGVSTSEPHLHLDVLEKKWTGQWESFDYVVISTGQWFLKSAIYLENETMIGCHSCQNKNLTEITYEYSFRKALRKTFQFITSSPHKPLVFYRTWAPSHFENGEWFSGGTCNRSAPFKPGEAGGRELDNKMWRVEKEEFDSAGENKEHTNTNRLKLLDTFELSLLRPDGHSGAYRTYHPYEKGRTASIQHDCLHWCLPGPIDAWNDIIMQMLAQG